MGRIQEMLKFILTYLLLKRIISTNIRRESSYIEEVNVVKLDNVAYDPNIHSHRPTPPKREFVSEYERIKHAMLVENAPMYELSKEDLNDEANQTSTRQLKDVTTLEKPAFFSFNQKNASYAYSFVLRSMKKSSSQFILYPFKFSFTPEATPEVPNPETSTYEDGGMFSLIKDKLPVETDNSYFKYLSARTNVNIGKAKALYDGDIAVLKLETTYEGNRMDLFYESDSYCNFFTNYIKKFSSCLLGKKDYLIQKATDPTKTALVYFNHLDILQNGLFDSDGDNSFNLLIVPDHVAGAQNEIKRLFTDKGIDLIKKFIDQGGHVLATGKSGYLFELWSVIPKGSYNTKYYLVSNSEEAKIIIKGCEDVYGKENEVNSDFIKHLMCNNDKKRSFLATSYFMNSPNGMDVLISTDRKSASLDIKNAEDGTLQKLDDVKDITEAQKDALPFLLSKTVKKGRLMIINGNPLFKLDYPSVFYNIFFAAMSKNVIFNTYIKFDSEEDLPIPGGEGGILIAGVVEFINLFSTPVSDFVMRVFIPDKVKFNSFDRAKCKISTEQVDDVNDDKLMSHAQHLECKASTVEQFDTFKQQFKLEILDQSVTQKATDVPIILPIIYYTDTETTIRTSINGGCLKVQAALAAILRGSLNPDPSGFYPLKCNGTMVDTNLQVENKENTIAKDVTFYGVFPLISPVLDGYYQDETAKAVKFYKHYYDANSYSYPWKVVGEQDYLDFQQLSGKSVKIADEWDQPVKMVNEIRASRHPSFGPDDVIDSVFGSPYADDPNIIMKQIHIIDPTLFFEHATPRLLAFINTATPEGAAAYYQGPVPLEDQDPDHPSQAKKNILFSRLDIFFYPVDQYQMPTNINQNHVISIDTYQKPSKDKCTEEITPIESILSVKGFFDSNNPQGLKSDEAFNVMWMYCYHQQINGTNQTELDQLSPDIKAVHYLVPIKDKDILRAGSLVGFEENADKSGFNKEYPVLQFIFGHKLRLIVGPADSRQGGKLVINLANNTFQLGVDPLEKGYITYSADQVAFYKTEWDATAKIAVAYFKRGLMPNEAYGKDSTIYIHFEKLTSPNDFQATIVLYEVKYDVTSRATNFEFFEERKTYKETIEQARFFSLPAIEIKTKMNRGGSSEIKEYELLAPYTRYGVYMQELIAHRTVWASGKTHHTTRPGIQIPNGMSSLISNIGISSIPFSEYLTHGRLLIPSAPKTSRLEWNDIWGRHWSQPLRSIFVDAPPLTCPKKNFMMQTSYELLADGGRTRVLDWPSDEEVVVRVQMKFKNNFQKYFIPTICPANRYSLQNREPMVRPEQLDILPSDFPGLTNEDTKDGEYHVSSIFSTVYGKCYQKEGSYLEGKKLTQADFDLMDYAMLCGASNDAAEIAKCADELKAKGVKTLKEREKKGTEMWNYSPSIEAYYPKNYIKPKMWDLTQPEYEDDAMNKGYKYHADNSVPGVDAAPTHNPAILQPHDLAAFPIFKGFGYQIEYDKNFGISKFAPYKGWWSDTLQNRDHTLLAGQSMSNDISVGMPSLLKSTDWVNARNIKNTANPDLIPSRLKNIYVCMFNQHRIRIKPEQAIFSYAGNTLQNYIVPIIADLNVGDERYTNYDCKSDFYQYSPQNISQVNNVILTSTSRDWLYFGVSLRGNAKETINVLLKLKPFSDRKYEGITKVQDGGRYVYWNPFNGANSFLSIDNNVNTVEAYRTDLEITSQVLPSELTTFKAILYHLHTVSDPGEYHREYPLSTYMNSYGFGDSAVSVYVGGTENTGLKVKKGEMTYVKITFYNNCGFDWHMLAGAIEFEEKDSLNLNAKDMLSGKIHMVQKPLAYNFLELTIPEELKPHVEFTPSEHNIDVPGQFFDFGSINIVTIADGFEGVYSFKLYIKDTFPDALRGKLLEVPVKLQSKYFDRLPKYNDPTTVHDYELKIPSIKFGVPDDDGKLYYTLGRVTDLAVQYRILKTIHIESVRFIDEAKIELVSNAVKDPETVDNALLEIWNSLDKKEIPFKEIVNNDASNNYNQVVVNLSSFFPEFPMRTKDKFDTTKLQLISKAYAPQLEFGYQPILYGATAKYVNKRNKEKYNYAEEPKARFSNVKGAWIRITYKYQLMKLNEETSVYEAAVDQRIFASDKGVLQVNVTVKNVGSDSSYDTTFSLYLDSNAEVDETKLPKGTFEKAMTSEGITVTLKTEMSVHPGDYLTPIFYVKFKPIAGLRALEAVKSRNIIRKMSANIALKDKSEIKVDQEILTPLTLVYPENGLAVRETVDATIINEGDFYSPKFKITGLGNPAVTATNEVVQYAFYRLKPPSLKWEVISELSTASEIIDEPFTQSETQGLTNYTIDYRVETYDTTKGKVPFFLASSLISYSGKLPISEADDSFPVWAIVVIVLASLLIVGSIIFLVVFYRRRAEQKNKMKNEAVRLEQNSERIVSTRQLNKPGVENMNNKYNFMVVKNPVENKATNPEVAQVSKFMPLGDKSLDKSDI